MRCCVFHLNQQDNLISGLRKVFCWPHFLYFHASNTTMGVASVLDNNQLRVSGLILAIRAWTLRVSSFSTRWSGRFNRGQFNRRITNQNMLTESLCSTLHTYSLTYLLMALQRWVVLSLQDDASPSYTLFVVFSFHPITFMTIYSPYWHKVLATFSYCVGFHMWPRGNWSYLSLFLIRTKIIFWSGAAPQSSQRWGDSGSVAQFCKGAGNGEIARRVHWQLNRAQCVPVSRGHGHCEDATWTPFSFNI